MNVDETNTTDFPTTPLQKCDMQHDRKFQQSEPHNVIYVLKLMDD